MGSMRQISNRRDEGSAEVLRRHARRDGRDSRLELQDRFGNRGLQRRLQRKLAVSHPQDSAEVEADRIAAEVVSGVSATGSASLQRSCCGGAAPCESCEGDSPLSLGLMARQVARVSSGSDALEAPADIVQNLGAGRLLDATTRSFMENRLGSDFGAVRVHDSAAADVAARSVDARAFTLGSDVVFRSGAYDPGSNEGKRLLAHELVHTIQQGASPVQDLPEEPGAAPST